MVYNYHETFKIPSEMFSKEEGEVIFLMTYVWYNSKTKKYDFYDGSIDASGITIILYKKINESKIRIY